MKRRILALAVAAMCGFAGSILAQNVDLNLPPIPFDPNKNLNESYDGFTDGGCRNMVINPSFEFFTPITGPTSPNTCYSNINRVYGWENIRLNQGFYHAGTPDLYYLGQPISGSGSYCEHCAVTTGDYAVQPLSTPPVWGNTAQAYAGLGLYYKRPGSPQAYDQAREYMVVKLREPLLPGVTYNISLKASLGETSLYSLPLQVYFTNSNFFNASSDPTSHVLLNNGTAGLVNLSPQSTSMAAWTDLTGTITPNNSSSYQYMVIGNFRNNAQTESAMLPNNPAPWTGINEWSIYYLIDEVSVVPNCTAASYIGGCNTQGFFDLNGNPSIPNPVENISTLTSQILGKPSIYIDYPIVVNTNFTFFQQELIFGPLGKLIVPAGRTLTIGSSYLHGCYSMWDGIEVQQGGSLNLNNSTVEDAQTAVRANGANSYSIIGNTFNKNKQHIWVEGHTSNALRSIYDNDFECTSTLKYPRQGELTGDAVTFRNCTPEMWFGSSVSGQNGNYVTQATNGLRIISSNIKIFNNSFFDIYGSSNDSWAIRSEHSGNLSNFRTVTIGGPAQNLRNQINNCRNGVLISGNQKATVENNYLNNVEIKGIEMINGILGTTSTTTTTSHNADFVVLQNVIYNTFCGIRFYNNGNARIKAYKNIVAYTGKTPPAGSVGIYIGEKANMKGTCRYWDTPNFTQEKIILDNKVYRYGHGILTDNTTCLWITDNTVFLLAPTTAQHHGIWYRNDKFAFVFKNNVTGNRLGWQTIGVRAENTKDSECGCNRITRNGYAQVNAGWNYSTKIYNNRIENTEQGITAWGGGVGTQVWDGTPRGAHNEWFNVQNINGQPRHFWAEGQSQQNHSLFYLPPVGSSANPPAQSHGFAQINMSNLSSSNYRRFRPDCNQNSPTWLKSMAMVESEVTEGILPEAAGQKLNYDIMLLELAFDSSWIDSSKVIEAYIDDIPNAVILWQAQSALTTGMCADVPAILAGINDPDDYELVYSRWLGTLADLCINKELNETVISRLTDIAELCEWEYGAPVYSARTILINEAGFSADDFQNCGIIWDENPGSSEENPEQEADNFIISPNPASFQVQVNNVSGNTVIYSLRNNFGTELLGGILSTGITNINTSSLLPGVYNVLYLDMLTGNVLETDILMIVQ